ncbi:MAG: DUF2235 domain-containing protein [Moraxella sp.]|nr:DUF2235 domain-containing protein [Moraxella sp.]
MQDLSDFGMDLTVSDKFKTVVHAVAANENRYQFGRRSIYESELDAITKNDIDQPNGNYRIEKGFMGAHSDIGGGYAEGDLSNASLMWMIKQAQDAGVKLDENVIKDKKYNEINNPIVHDSVWSIPVVYTMGGQFRWANDSSKGVKESSIFNNYSHLGLNWHDTKVFQNPNNKKFDSVEKMTKFYLLDPTARFSLYPLMAVNPSVYLQHMNYIRYKDDSVLIANKTDEVFAINDYLTWLNCNYGLSLTHTNINPNVKVPSNLTVQQLCSGLSLSSYVKK